MIGGKDRRVLGTKCFHSKAAQSTTAKQRRALDVLNNVLADHGQRAPDATHYPASVLAVIRNAHDELRRDRAHADVD